MTGRLGSPKVKMENIFNELYLNFLEIIWKHKNRAELGRRTTISSGWRVPI
jgi:hypothetical protein